MGTVELPTGGAVARFRGLRRWLYGLGRGLCLPVAAPRTYHADGVDVVLDGIGGVLSLRPFLIVMGTSSELFHGGFSHGREANIQALRDIESGSRTWRAGSEG
jgi:hypothetical protein